MRILMNRCGVTVKAVGSKAVVEYNGARVRFRCLLDAFDVANQLAQSK